MPNNIELNQKEQIIIAVGASVAAGCQPCTSYHMKAARAAGVCDRGMALAVETALAGRSSATTAIGEWAERCQGARPEIDTEFRRQQRLIVELTSIATAVAVNSVSDLQNHLTVAQESGARSEQIQSAIDIALKIKRVAEEKIEAITSQLAGSLPPATTAAAGTGPDPINTRKIADGAGSDCGCR